MLQFDDRGTRGADRLRTRPSCGSGIARAEENPAAGRLRAARPGLLAITALAADQITYENSSAITIGSNVGTTVTALLGAMSANVAGKRQDAARLFVARVLRATARIAEDREAATTALAAIGAEIDGFDIVESGTLDQLIRERRITPAMATSLLNDSGYVMNIRRKLSEADLIVLRNKTYDFLQQMRAAAGGQGSGTAVADAVVGIEATGAGDALTHSWTIGTNVNPRGAGEP